MIAKQDLVQLQIEFVSGVKEMCDVSFPVAGMSPLIFFIFLNLIKYK